jgi:hypothetical protein
MKFKILRNSQIEERAVAGTIVYKLRKNDFGAAKDDSKHTGIKHISVTYDPEGKYPFFTIPEQDLELIK